MIIRIEMTVVAILIAWPAMVSADGGQWWDARWRLRTTVGRATPREYDSARPIEVAVDLPLLLDRAKLAGEYDPGSVRVVERRAGGPGREVPFARRVEPDTSNGGERTYLAWIAQPRTGTAGEFDLYFDTTDRGIEARTYESGLLPPENLLANPGFEDQIDGRPAAWAVTPPDVVGLGRFAQTTGRRSLKIAVNADTARETLEQVVISQRIDVREFAGEEMVFECDLLAQRAPYGAPVSIQLQQFRGDGSRILEYAVDPRWLTVEAAQGQLVQFRQRGRFSRQAAAVNVWICARCKVSDADSGGRVESGPESWFTLWLDRMVVRPGERRPWPAATNAGFVEGAFGGAGPNRGFEFTGQRRLAFCGASEGTLTAGKFNPDPKSVHWGLEAGSLEFWCRPSWNSNDGVQRIFFTGYAYLYRLQSQLRKLGADGDNGLQFSIADANRDLHTIGGPALLSAGRWHHIAATWDFPRAHLQLFLDGKLVSSQGPGDRPWPSSRLPGGPKEFKGNGITSADKRSLPMQAFLGGSVIEKKWPSGDAVEAVIDEFRISDVARYDAEFVPRREEFSIDGNTRALFHLENDRNGVHDGDDGFLRGYLGCEMPPRQEQVGLDVFGDGRIEQRTVVVKPHPSADLFAANRGETRLPYVRPVRRMPDPRFIEYRGRHVERIVDGSEDAFTLEVGGDLQPLMRSITFEPAVESNAETTLLPRWRANDNVVPFSVESIAATLAPDVTDDTQKAVEVFKYALRTGDYYDANYCETLPGGRQRPRVSYTMIKALNIYPFDQCGPQNFTLRKLFLAAGISSNNAPGTHHQFQQAFCRGDWRLFDLAARMYWLNRDNRTVLGLRGLEEDPYLRLRGSEVVNSYFPGRVGGASLGAAVRPHSMDFSLRPGERAAVCWHNEGRWFEVSGANRQSIGLSRIPPYFGNGAIVYRPSGGSEAESLENIEVENGEDGSCVLRPKDPAKPATLIYRARCPYIFSDGLVSGTYTAGKANDVTLSLSFDEGKSWTTLWQSPEKSGPIAARLLRQVTGRYAYWLKIELAAGEAAWLTNPRVRTVFVEAPRSLPGKLSLGENRISFVGGRPSVPVKTRCSWVQRHQSELGVWLNSIGYYHLDSEYHHNLLIATPGTPLPLSVTVTGRKLSGHVSLEDVPRGWSVDRERQPVELRTPDQLARVNFTLTAEGVKEGDIHSFNVVVREPHAERRLPVQILVAGAPLIREAEQADEISGGAVVSDVPELSSARGVFFKGNGKLGFEFSAGRAGKYALWLRARWEPGTDGVMPLPPVAVRDLARYTPGSKPALTLRIDEGDVLDLRPFGMRGFMNETLPGYAYTKKFYAYGKAHEHWAWYRVPDVEVAAGEQRLILGAIPGTSIDALLLLPRDPVMDRAAMNLFQNWNYSPWNNPI